MNLESAKKMFKTNFLGPDELRLISDRINLHLPKSIPDIEFDLEDVDPKEYVLIFGCNQLADMAALSLKKLIDIFGFQYKPNDVCFYNQDWYFNEDFANRTLLDRWYLVQKNVHDETRGKIPDNHLHGSLPSAILCAYTFFTWWLIRNEILWPNDYIWCSDTDSHNDQIYVGKFTDKDDLNRSGFSIHRHLSIKSNYGSIIAK